MLNNMSEQHAGDADSARGAGAAINPGDTSFNLEKIIGFEPLFESMWKCCKNVMWKDSTVSYVLNGIERTLKLEEELKTGTYTARPPKYFTIYQPKKREIVSIVFRDRVYQRSQNDNAVYPLMSRSFIYDNMACQIGKGTDRARSRVKCFLQKMFRVYGFNFFAFQVDIHGYYPNMRHDKTEANFAKHMPHNVMGMVANTLHGQYKGDVGYNPGSQLIQIAGISLPDDLDHFIKEQLHIKYYIRYMDDLILLHEDEKYLEYCKQVIGARLSSLGFEYNPKKTRIYPVTEGILFLGFTFKLTNTGKVLMLLDSQNVRNERRRLRKLVALAKKGERTRAKVLECYAGWRNHAMKGNNHRIVFRMDQYLKSLWSE